MAEQIRHLSTPVSISDQIYQFLKEGIISGRMKPGIRLIENKISEDFATSRTPVREAFRRLEQDGLVERVPQRGIRVTLLSAKTLKEVFGIRSVLEPYAAELACDNIQKEDLSELRRISAEAESLLFPSEGDDTKHGDLGELNTRFHDVILRASKNEQLIKLVGQLGQLITRFRSLSLSEGGTRMQVWREHRQIIDLLEKREKGKLKSLMLRHVEEAGAAAIKALQNLNSQPDESANDNGEPT